MNQLIASLLATLHLMAGYSVAPPAHVEIVPAAQLSQMVCKGGCSPSGLYKDGTLYLSDGLDLSTPMGRSIVFHELVHHAQRMASGSEAHDCQEWTRREMQAYALQNRYLNEIERAPQRVFFNGTCR